MDLDAAAAAFRDFVAIVQRLRTPGTGCPWDLEQDQRTLRPYLIEETHEVLEAIDAGDDTALCGELGDLLLQVVLHAQVATDRGAFSITEVVGGISAKMIRRHPHVFGTAQVSSVAEVSSNWEKIKAEEGAGKAGGDVFARLPRGLPALQQAQRVEDKAARAGWPVPPFPAVLDQIGQQLAEVREAVGAEATTDRDGLEYQLGELLFSICQLARGLGLSAEDSLRAATSRFVAAVRDQELRNTEIKGEVP